MTFEFLLFGTGTPTLTQDQNQVSGRLDMDSVSISSSANPSHVYQSNYYFFSVYIIEYNILNSVIK